MKSGESFVIRFIYPFRDDINDIQSFGVVFHYICNEDSFCDIYEKKVCPKYKIDDKKNLYIDENITCKICNLKKYVNNYKILDKYEYVNLGIILEQNIIENNVIKKIKTPISRLTPKIYCMNQYIYEEILNYTYDSQEINHCYDINEYNFKIEMVYEENDLKYNIQPLISSFNKKYEKTIKTISTKEYNYQDYIKWYKIYLSNKMGTEI